MDIRHEKRIKIVQELYSFLFTPSTKLSDKSKKIIDNLTTIDKKIMEAAPKYEIDKISKVDLSILRLAIYELHIEKEAPAKVVINEAIELAKELAGERSPGFINAVLGKIYEKFRKS